MLDSFEEGKGVKYRDYRGWEHEAVIEKVDNVVLDKVVVKNDEGHSILIHKSKLYL